ncbi:hypothetical protein MUY14_08795 [Amycolatopsis sp. FBCC-B4732]|uniref:hypothetical protein n=1 Tax=Amycolatopsis sp. FBCC-B4732 TaxID=3079339 RepID=UPI001FF2CAFB|nr:hypothetical protein [Amycolatopsis sp. FBCC-B4732]UOX90706.1 hypothetical protein MUY14_08795 [Amycolatopsis sp. FBCC-B4732]
MRVMRYEPSDDVGRARLNTNTVARLDDVGTFTELLGVLARIRAEHRPARILCTLDDVSQCAYTSGHATEDDRLWFDDGDIDHDDPIARRRADDGRAARIAAALDDPGQQFPWQKLPGDRLGGEADVAALVEVNRNPDGFLDDVVLIQRVPVARDDLAIAGIPNGYFTSDWDVFQNHTIIRRMAAHGYRLLGIGASLLGFDRPAPPAADKAEAVVADLQHLYGAPSTESWAELAALLPQRQLLFLGYTENFPDLLG